MASCFTKRGRPNLYHPKIQKPLGETTAHKNPRPEPDLGFQNQPKNVYKILIPISLKVLLRLEVNFFLPSVVKINVGP